MPQQERLNIAVFIDFDNIEIGVKSTLGQQFDVGAILDAIKERGEIVTKIAYADWTRAGDYSRAMTQHAIRLVQRNLTPGGDKNGADINLALDALEMAFTHPHINAYVIVGGDSDFLSLVEKLKQYDKKVLVVGGRAFTSVILQRNCHEFIAYENLTGVRRTPVKGGRPAPSPSTSPIAQAFPIVRRALQILADREVSPQTGLLKSTLLQLDSTFSERNYGASSFLDFVEKLAQAGLVQLKHAGRSVMVELNAGFQDPEAGGRATAADQPTLEPPAAAVAAAPIPFPQPAAAPSGGGPQAAAGTPSGAVPHHALPPIAPEDLQPAAEGVKLVGRLLSSANARWPMYLRNVKQVLRAGQPGFDERRYGFGGLMDLMRACQRDGLVRLERDRRGGLRVFPGQALQRPATPGYAPSPSQPSQAHVDLRVADAEHLEMPDEAGAESSLVADVEAIEIEPVPIDTTAELLGRAKPKRPRTRVAAAGARKAARPAAGARKATPRRTPRGKKAGDTNSGTEQ